MSEERTRPSGDPLEPAQAPRSEGASSAAVSAVSPALPASIDEPGSVPSQAVEGETEGDALERAADTTMLEAGTEDTEDTENTEAIKDTKDVNLGDNELVLDIPMAAPPRSTGIGAEEPALRIPGKSLPGEGVGQRRWGLVKVSAAAVIAAALALLIVRALSTTYYVYRCGTEHITAESGRTFSPWGTSPLSGPEWAPIRIPKSIRCEDHTLETREELLSKYREALIQQAETWIVELRPYGSDIERMGEVKAQLEQALLLSRDAGSDQVRGRIDRLLADLEYWQARSELSEAALRLEAAAKQLGEAARRQPMHNKDAAAWQSLSDKVVEMLEVGPSALDEIARPSIPALSQRSAPTEPTAEVLLAPPASPATNPGGDREGNIGIPEQPGASIGSEPQPGEVEAPTADSPAAPQAAEGSDPAPTAPPDEAAVPATREQAPPPDAGLPRGGKLI